MIRQSHQERNSQLTQPHHGNHLPRQDLLSGVFGTGLMAIMLALGSRQRSRASGNAAFLDRESPKAQDARWDERREQASCLIVLHAPGEA
jgi:hypothetical protein